MSLWTMNDNSAGKPKNLSSDQKSQTYGVDVTESKQAEAKAKGIAHAGWVKVVAGTGGRAGRYTTEVLVAGGSMTSDASDDTILPDGTITIGTAPAAHSVTAPAATTFAVVATASPTAALSYQWQTNGGSGSTYTNITNGGVYSGATTATLSISNSTGLNGYKYRVVVSATGMTAKTSTGVTLTVA